MQNSYSDFRSNNLRDFRAYEIDFTNRGDFFEEASDADTCLCVSFYPGMRIDDKWMNTGNSDDDSYLFYLEYKNQEHIEVSLMSLHSASPNDKFEESYNFVKGAAERFFLVNNIIDKVSECGDLDIVKKWSLASIKPPTWEDVEELLDYYKDYGWVKGEAKDLNTWRKSMTVDEAKELFLFLEVAVNFPE